MKVLGKESDIGIPRKHVIQTGNYIDAYPWQHGGEDLCTGERLDGSLVIYKIYWAFSAIFR